MRAALQTALETRRVILAVDADEFGEVLVDAKRLRLAEFVALEQRVELVC